MLLFLTPILFCFFSIFVILLYYPQLTSLLFGLLGKIGIYDWKLNFIFIKLAILTAISILLLIIFYHLYIRKKQIQTIQTTNVTSYNFSFIALLIILTLFLLLGIEDHPLGYPQHTTFHFEVSHRVFLQHFTNGEWLHVLKRILDAQQGFAFFIESAFYSWVSPSYYSSHVLPMVYALLCVVFMYLSLHKLFGQPVAFVCAGLLAGAPWFLAFARYTDTEHISAVLYVILCAFVIGRIKDNCKKDMILAGTVIGLGFYLYAASQMVSLVVFPVFYFYLLFVLKLKNTRYLLGSYLLSSAPAVIWFWQRGQLLPLRTPYNTGYVGYDIQTQLNILETIKKISVLLNNSSADPWYLSTFGALTPVESVLLPLALLLSMFFLALPIVKKFDFTMQQKMIFIFFSLCTWIGFLPLFGASEICVRRIIPAMLGILFFTSLSLTLLLQNALRKFQNYILVIFVFAQLGFGFLLYFKHVDSFEAGFNYVYEDLSVKVLGQIENDKKYLVCFDRDNDVDANNTTLFLNFISYKKSGLWLSGVINFDDRQVVVLTKSQCATNAKIRYSDRQILRVTLRPQGEWGSPVKSLDFVDSI